MKQPLPKIYDVTHFDAEGQEINPYETRSLEPLSGDAEREVQFMERAVAMGAASYQVHIMKPHEVKQRLKEEAKAAKPDFLTNMARSFGLFDLIGVVTYLDDQPATRGAN